VLAQRRLDSAHRRYLQAIRALATVRKLLPRPPTPVEIADQLQVNASKARAARRKSPRSKDKVLVGAVR
jgi:hypothetical protein